MGIFDFFKKKKASKNEEENICDRYIKGSATAEELLDEIVYMFIQGCTEYFAQTARTVRKIDRENADDYAEELIDQLKNGVLDSVPDEVKKTILKLYQSHKEDNVDMLLKTRDMCCLCMSFLNISHYVGVGMLVKPDPLFDIFRLPKINVLNEILERKEACEKAFFDSKSGIFPDGDGTYVYPEFPDFNQLSLYYDLMRGLYDLLGEELGQYTNELNDGRQEFLDVYTDMYTMTWNPALAPMINPENGQISLPDENGVWRPIEPDYIGMMKEIDFKGVI